jgi:hypothetical protein
MADSEANRELHRARLAAANQALQQSVATRTNNQRAFRELTAPSQTDLRTTKT